MFSLLLIRYPLFVASTHDQNVFSFFPDHRCCNGFKEALARYREIVPCLKLSGMIKILSSLLDEFIILLQVSVSNIFNDFGQLHYYIVMGSE